MRSWGADVFGARGRVGLAGSGLPRRLAALVEPVVGESFGSWLDRFAADHELPAGLAALRLGLEVNDGPGSVRPVWFGVALTPGSREGLVAATGVAGEVFEAMQLSCLDGTALDLSGLDLADGRSLLPVAVREWALFCASRACPCCVGEDGVWPLWWRLGAAAVCVRHRVVLVDVCPRCGLRLRRGGRRQWSGLPRMVVADPYRCGGRCPQVIAEIPVVGASEVLVEAQRAVLRAVAGLPAPVAGQAVDAAGWFAALRYLAAMVRFVGREVAGWPGVPPLAAAALRADRDRGRGELRLQTMPSTGWLAAAVLTVAGPVLGAADAAGCAAELEGLAGAFVVARRGRRNPPLRMVPVGEPLAGVLAGVVPPRWRVVAGVGAARWPSGLLQPRNIPHLVDAGDYTDLIAGLLGRVTPVNGRRLAALGLARLAGADSWAGAGRVLGMDPVAVERVSGHVVGGIGDPAAFWVAVAAVGERMVARGLVDFAARREVFAGLLAVPRWVLFAVCRPLGLPVSLARRRMAAAWVWQRYTGGDVWDAPALRGGWAERFRRRYELQRRLACWLCGPVEAAVCAWAEGLLAEAGVR